MRVIIVLCNASVIKLERFLILSFASRFDIRLMKEGRMKGQAFIGLPNEKAAAKALKEANGYVLFEKPMVVVSFSSNSYILFFVSSPSISSFALLVFYLKKSMERGNRLRKPGSIA